MEAAVQRAAGDAVTDRAPLVLPGGGRMPRLGQGTWDMGVRRRERRAEVRALQLGVELGMTLIDTAEMYADAESVVGEAIADRREQVFLVSKVLPDNASREGVLAACARSLRKLRTEWLDLYLLHWESRYPLAETFAAFAQLRAEGRIRAFGVSNFDASLLREARRAPGGEELAANQILYNLWRRGPEAELIGACQEHRIAVMSYTPLEQGRIQARGALTAVAERHGATPAQVAIAWTLRLPGIASIPKAVREEHVRENARAVELSLTSADLDELDRSWPRRTAALEFL
jgi:diketogulonate reductase-like aldo/keto reductase